MDDILLLYTTWPDPETAEQVASAVIGEGLAACANILAPSLSIFPWEGELRRASETVMILKVAAPTAPALRDRIIELHPYDIPAVVALPVAAEASSTAFVWWVCTSTEAPG